jgi:hypothetical protein
MQLYELVGQAIGFDIAAPKDKIKLFAWWIHVHDGKEFFNPADIRACFNKLHIDEPPALATYITRLADAKDIIAERGKYKLARSVRSELDRLYGVHHSVVAVSKILTDLPTKVPTIEQRAFLQEALTCYKFQAYRACIVMTWNLAYAHLVDYILSDPQRLADFNAAITKKYPKKTNIVIAQYDDFTEELSERETVEIANVANTFSSVVFRILKKELDRRNIAAHPSNVVVSQHQADDMVSELINNVVLALT